MNVDLHIHTNASDGELSPIQLVDRAIKDKMDVIAITDHDTVAALLTIEKNITDSIEVISGIELSARDEYPIHILGYYIDIHNRELTEELDRIKLLRIKEIKRVIEKLNQNLDSTICVREIVKTEKKLTMNSIADFLCKRGFSISRQDAYDKYLGNGKSAFIQKECLRPEKAIELILSAGGIPVLAHPNRIKIDKYKIEKMIRYLTKCGLMGVEVYCRNMKEINEYKRMCKENCLIITAGSDFHRKDDVLGQWSKNQIISDKVYAQLKETKENLL